MTGLRLTYPEQFREQLKQGYVPIHYVTFRGTTEDTNKTELFIDGKADARLLLPANSAGLITKHVVGWNETDQALATNSGEVGGATYSCILSSGSYTKTATQTGTHVTVDIENDGATTSEAFSVFVTADDATDTVYWEVTLEILCLTFGEATAPTGIFDDIQK